MVGSPNKLTLPGIAAGVAFKCCCNFVDCFECLIFLCFFFSPGNTSFDLRLAGLVVSVLLDVVTTVPVMFAGGIVNILGLSIDGKLDACTKPLLRLVCILSLVVVTLALLRVMVQDMLEDDSAVERFVDMISAVSTDMYDGSDNPLVVCC